MHPGELQAAGDAIAAPGNLRRRVRCPGQISYACGLVNSADSGLFSQTPLSVLETNIDNMNPAAVWHVMSRLFEAGALDVYYTPIFHEE